MSACFGKVRKGAYKVVLPMNLFLQNRLAVVTGAARGIGKAIAEGFLREGACVLAVDRDEAIRAVVGDMGEGDAHALVCDLRAPDAAAEVARQAESLGGCGMLVNNAGISMPAAVDEIQDEDWQAVMDINLNAAFRLTRSLWGQLREKRGSIVNLASFAAKRATLFGNNASYTVSKHGIAGLTRAAAKDGAPLGIRVNAVAPGVVDTDLVKLHDAQTRARIQEMIPLGVYAQPSEIADAVLFLASRRASHITGEVLNINGGLVMD